MESEVRMNTTYDVDVLVLGAGISGLTTAFLLARTGRSVCVLEATDRVGGAIRSERREGFLVEAGPNSTLETTPLLTALIRDAGVEAEKRYAADAASNRYILKRGRLVALPTGPAGFVRTPLFSLRTKLGLFREPFIPPAPDEVEEMLSEFVVRRLGNEFLDYAINPFVAGVYAGDPTRLSVEAAFPKLHTLERTYGSLLKGLVKGAKERKKRAEESKQSARMFSFRDGMQTLTDALAKTLPRVRTGHRVRALTPLAHGGFEVEGTNADGGFRLSAPALVLSMPSHAVVDLLRESLPAAVPALEGIVYPPVAVVQTAYRPTPEMHPLDGFGFLIPEVEHRDILGTIFTSTIFGDRGPAHHVVLTSFVGGMRQPDHARISKDEILQMVEEEQTRLLGTPPHPVFAAVTTWDRAIPQYMRGHLDRMRMLEDLETAHPGLAFCANYRGGISVGDCVKSAHATVERLSALFDRSFNGTI